MKLYRREQYLKKIRPFYDDDGLIKVITGIRRCGKSCLMQTVAEELGERGAKIGAFRIDPDIALAVDVSFGLSDSEEREKCGELGKGAMIGISPCLSRDISDRLISTARVVEIPYQIEVMNGSTGTNADRYSVNREGAKTCTISIPLRNMHTPAEVIDLRDVRAAAELIAEFVKETEE